MNTLSHFWTAINTPPPTDSVVEVRFADGSSSLVTWTGTKGFPNHTNLNATSWRLVPELEDLYASAS